MYIQVLFKPVRTDCSITSGSALFVNKNSGCFAFIVFWMSCYCKCSVALPQDAMGWSAVSDCGIF